MHLDSKGQSRAVSQRVLYLGGSGRSGSTVLSVVLNSLPSFIAVGEVRYIWLQGVQENLLCACGRPFLECDFWTAVGERAFGGWDQLEVERPINLARRVDRHRFIPQLLSPGRSAEFEEQLSEYRNLMSALYRAVADVSGCKVVVDSTKEPPFALVIRGIEDIDIRLVHLVRDSRGVAYSWMRRKRRPEVRAGEAFMAQYGPLFVSFKWVQLNILMHHLVRGIGGLTTRYEDLVDRPIDVLRQVVQHAGESVSDDDLLAVIEGRVLQQNHSIAGNPLRFERGPLRLRRDDEWRSQMRTRDRLLVTAITAPLLRRYAYLTSPRRSRTRGRSAGDEALTT